MAWTSPRTWVAGEKPTAATFNTHVRDNFKAIGDAWTSYTPTATNLTIGNGTLSGGWMQAGKFTVVRISVTFGTTTTVSAAVSFALPATASAFDQAIAGWLLDSSAGNTGRVPASGSIMASASTVTVYSSGGSLTSTVPFTWATGDKISLTGVYEAA